MRLSWHCWRGEEESQTDLRLKGLRLRVARTSSFYLWCSLVLGWQLLPKRYLFPLGVSRRTLGIKALKCHLQRENGLTANASRTGLVMCYCVCVLFFFPFQNSCLSWTHILKCLLSNLVRGIPSTTHHSEQGASSHHVCQRSSEYLKGYNRASHHWSEAQRLDLEIIDQATGNPTVPVPFLSVFLFLMSPDLISPISLNPEAPWAIQWL